MSRDDRVSFPGGYDCSRAEMVAEFFRPEPADGDEVERDHASFAPKWEEIAPVTFVEEVDVDSRTITCRPGPYNSLATVLREAFEQASAGKGKERHAKTDEPFERQIICEVRRRVGSGYTKGQAVKKIYESDRLEGERGVAELLGAINYLAAEIIVRREEKR